MAFMEEDILEPELYAAVRNNEQISRVPTESEVRDILQPFRPERIRKAARVYVDYLTRNWQDPVFVRTYYEGGAADEEKMLRWIPSDERSGNAVLRKEDRWWRLLNNESLFEVGDDWSRIYEVLPEVIAYRNDRRSKLDMRAVLASAKRSMSKDPWIEKLERQVQEEVQFHCRNTLIIFDKVFFDTCDLSQEKLLEIEKEDGETGALLVFLDKKGYQLRASRVGEGILDVLDISYFRVNTSELGCWEDAVVGDKYKPEGEIGRQYYGPQGTKWTIEPGDVDDSLKRIKGRHARLLQGSE